MIDPHEAEHVGVEVLDGEFILGDAVAVFVGGAVGHAAFGSTTGHPDAEALRVVVAAIGALSKGSASEFSGEDQEGGVEKSTLLEIFNERGDGLINGESISAVTLLEVGVLIPAITISCSDRQLDKADPFFVRSDTQEPAPQDLESFFLVREAKFYRLLSGCR